MAPFEFSLQRGPYARAVKIDSRAGQAVVGRGHGPVRHRRCVVAALAVDTPSNVAPPEDRVAVLRQAIGETLANPENVPLFRGLRANNLAIHRRHYSL